MAQAMRRYIVRVEEEGTYSHVTATLVHKPSGLNITALRTYERI